MIFPYLLKSSQMSVKPYNTGFTAFLLLSLTSYFFSYIRIFWYWKVVKPVVNTYATRRLISAFALSTDAWAYQSNVILMLECPMIYCKSFGFMFLCASLVQNV